MRAEESNQLNVVAFPRPDPVSSVSLSRRVHGQRSLPKRAANNSAANSKSGESASPYNYSYAEQQKNL